MKKQVVWKILAFTVFLTSVFSSTTSSAATYICEEEANTGFHSDRGPIALRWQTNRYRIKTGITEEEIPPHLSPREIFTRHNRYPDYYLPPAGIVIIGQFSNELVGICEHTMKSSFPSYDWITCEGSVFFAEFRFDLNSGRFSVYQRGYESQEGGNTWIGVGKCRRID